MMFTTIRARARVLLDVLSTGRVNITKAMTGAEQEREQELNQQLVSLKTRIYREKQRQQADQNGCPNWSAGGRSCVCNVG